MSERAVREQVKRVGSRSRRSPGGLVALGDGIDPEPGAPAPCNS
jgi:hypothetical protein